MNNSRKLSNPFEEIKIVIIGESTVGKSSIILNYSMHSFEEEHNITVIDTYTTKVTVDNREIILKVWDTAGQEQYALLRTLSYPKTNVFIICYSMVDPYTFNAIRNKWFIEVSHHCPNAQVILAGTKKDLVDNEEVLAKLKEQNSAPIGINEAIDLKRDIGAYAVIETSSRTGENIKKAFDLAIQAALTKKRNPRICRFL